MPGDDAVADAAAEDASDASGQPRLGLYLAPLTPELRRERDIPDGSAGVYVARVEPNSPAERAGIEPGTLISMVGGQPVTSPDQVVAAVRKAADDKRESVLLRVEKEGKPLFVAVPFAA
jgi:serine protease Do